MMYTLVSFATYWGSKYGGINAFNADFLGEFGTKYKSNVQVICLAAVAEPHDIEEAKKVNVQLVKLPYPPQDKTFSKDQAKTAIDALKDRGINFEPEATIWLGHDRISGEAAIEATKLVGGRSALIHHMSYEAYEGFAEDSQGAHKKIQVQKELFKQADLLLAVGPLLHEALADLLDKDPQDIHCLIPGLADIEPRKNTPNKFRVFLSGRLSDDAKKIKQGHLGIAGLGQAIQMAHLQHAPKMLTNEPQMILRGVDFESKQDYNNETRADPEKELQQFAENYAQRRINLLTLPYTQDRHQLYEELKQSCVALMPSWHEGFGLVAWEAIAAGVPVIVSRNSGVYRLLKQDYQDGLVQALDIDGKTEAPFFTDKDLNTVAEAIKTIANDVEAARGRAAELRSRLASYTWSKCVAEVAHYFAWNLPQNPSDPPQSPHKITTSTQPSLVSKHKPDSPLVMPRKYWRQGLPESRLLWADEAVVPFEIGSSTFLADMQAWLDVPQWLQAIRLVTGTGGTGKTRLSLELCQQRLQAGWCCGFWSSQEGISPAALWQSLLNQNQPLLVVIDYAETRQSALLALVKAMLQQPNPQPVRLLLLARTGGEWWDNLPSKDRDCELLLSSYATSGPYSLPLLYVEADQRGAAYQRAVKAYAQALGISIPAIQPDLTGEHFAKPLYLQMAALLALLGEHPATADGLTKALLTHERRYWAKALADCQLPAPEKLAQHLLGLVTLAGGFATAKAAWPYWEAASDTPLDSVKFSQLFNTLTPLYPGKQGLQPVQPDLLGEALVAQILTQPAGQILLAAVLPKLELQHACLTVLARLVSHRPNLANLLQEALKSHFVACCKTIIKVAVETPGSLTQLACEAFSQLSDKDKSQAAGLLEPLLKDESVELARLDYMLSAFEVKKTSKKLAKLGRQAKDSLRLEHANNLNNLSIAMLRVGGFNEAAFACAKDAVAICRLLMQQKSSDDFGSVFANCLNTYSGCLSDLGKTSEALAAAKQALAIRERLAGKNPDRFEPDYAASLSNYASHLSDSGKTEDALAAVKQALAIRERLAGKNPDRFEPDYATSLSNYANHLGDLGQTKEALDAAGQALVIRKRLVGRNPDRFEPNYEISLINYANHLRNSGKTEEALVAANQALTIMERLATKNPNRYEADRFLRACNALFLAWLDEPTSIDAVPFEVPSCIAEHEKPKLGFYLAVVQGCLSANQEQRRIAFSSAYSLWQTLSAAQQNNDGGHYFCICAWLHQYQPEVLHDDDVAARWQAFQQKRSGNLPQWMLTVAERLQFTWFAE